MGQYVVPGLQHLHRVKKACISPYPYQVTQQQRTIYEPHRDPTDGAPHLDVILIEKKKVFLNCIVEGNE